MYLKRKNKGYGWYAKVKTTNDNKEAVGYINFSFKKDCEPDELDEYGSYQGELFFRDSAGKERKVFPIANEFNGKTYIDFKLLEAVGVSISHGGLGSLYQSTLDGSHDEEYYKAKAKEEVKLNDLEEIDFY